MTAIADVARLAGVSKATASRALSGRGYVSADTRERVLRAAEESGYVASPNAASLVTGRTKNVGVVIPFISRWFFAQVLEGIEDSLLAAGYDMTLYNIRSDSPERDRIFDYFLARKRFDAVIAVSVELTEREIDVLHRLGKPLVGIGGPLRGVPTLAIDDVAAARLATEHLLSLGHTDVVHLGGKLAEEMDFHVHGKRLLGFTQAMRAAGIDPSSRFVPADMGLQGGVESGLRLLGNPYSRPTGVFAFSDEIAIGVILAARQLGIAVPHEVSVVGIDGHEYAPLFDLTTVEQHPRQQGERAVDLLLRQLDRRSPTSGGETPGDDPSTEESDAGRPATEPGVTPVAVDLVIRSSTTAPRPPMASAGMAGSRGLPPPPASRRPD